MSQENVEVVRASLEAWNAEDMDALREFYDPGAIVRPPEGWPEPGPFVGREAVMRQWEQLRETFDADALELISDFIDAADRVVVRVNWRGAGRGPESNMEMTDVFTVRKGRISIIECFWDHAEALEAVGLAEQAMSQENVEIVRRAYEAFNRAGLDALLEHFHPDLEYDITAGVGPYAGMYYGRGAVRSFLADYLESWEYVRMEPEDFIEVGEDQVVVPLRLHMRGKGSGVEVEAQTTNVWTVRDGQAVRIAVYNDKAEAFAAAGLSDYRTLQ